MDIYRFINSKAIAEHCRSIGHQFDALEMAYLVYANESLDIAQKHAAFEEIIREQPDMEVVERPWTPHFDSLHAFLKLYMETENKYLDIFYREEPDSVYSFEIVYSDIIYSDQDNRLFSSFAACYRAIRDDVADTLAHLKQKNANVSLARIHVTKKWINNNEDDESRYMAIDIDYDNNPTQIFVNQPIATPDDGSVLLAFEGLWPVIPTPFQKGDILIAPDHKISESYPFVLDSIPYWDENNKNTHIISGLKKAGDSGDMIAMIYGQDGDGSIWHGHGAHYLEMEYCERELQGTERILIALSNYLKGDISLELFLYAYDILRNQQRVSEERVCTKSFCDTDRQKAGIE